MRLIFSLLEIKRKQKGKVDISAKTSAKSSSVLKTEKLTNNENQKSPAFWSELQQDQENTLVFFFFFFFFFFKWCE